MVFLEYYSTYCETVIGERSSMLLTASLDSIWFMGVFHSQLLQQV